MAEIMLDARSPLASASAFDAPGISIREEGGFTLTQVAGFGKAFEKALATEAGKLPAKVGTAGVKCVAGSARKNSLLVSRSSRHKPRLCSN